MKKLCILLFFAAFSCSVFATDNIHRYVHFVNNTNQDLKFMPTACRYVDESKNCYANNNFTVQSNTEIEKELYYTSSYRNNSDAYITYTIENSNGQQIEQITLAQDDDYELFSKNVEYPRRISFDNDNPLDIKYTLTMN